MCENKRAKAMRDFVGEVFTVWHCLVEDVEPLGESEEIYYMGCPTCKKKMCDHKEDKIPLYLANVLLMTFDCKVQAKAIGNVIEEILKIPAGACEPNKEGCRPRLETALNNARATPMNCKFIIGAYREAAKNVLELVQVKHTVDKYSNTVIANMPSSMMKLVDTDIKGAVPCSIGNVRIQKNLKILFDKPVNTVQMLVAITDTGEEHGCMTRDEEHVRISRKGVCLLSKEKQTVILQRTGELASMSRFCRWNSGDVVYVIGRIISFDGDQQAYRIAMTADMLLKPEIALFWNTYFFEYHKYVTECFAQPVIALEKHWTPKKRRVSIGADSASSCTLTPHPLQSTPISLG